MGQATGIFDLYGYFYDRRRYLRHRIDLEERALVELDRQLASAVDEPVRVRPRGRAGVAGDAEPSSSARGSTSSSSGAIG